MKSLHRIPDVFRWDGAVGRGYYALVGTLGFAAKHNLDRLLAAAFGRPWGPFNYLVPVDHAIRFATLSPGDARFLAAMLLLALPFIWVGVAMTVRRLRSAGLPKGLVVLFFVPFINVLFFILLSILPSRGEAIALASAKYRWGEFIPEGRLAGAALAILVTAVLALVGVRFGIYGLGRYGWGIFVGIPFTMGLTAALLHGYHRPRTLASCVGVANLSVVLLGLGLFAFAMEGIVCLAMALPLAIPLATLGGMVGYFLQRQPGEGGEALAAILVVIASLGALMGAEAWAGPESPDLEVRSTVVINAPAETVWRNVVSFSELPPPSELAFRLGIAYPIRATIDGKGPGALRRCVFSTGAFEEPINMWDAPRRLAFSVRSMPPPMQEWTPYRDIHPPHLQDYLAVTRGEFLLTALDGGRTRLEGTTWYRHNLWPAAYWQVWSDEMIELIHLRVLRHIKLLSENSRRT